MALVQIDRNPPQKILKQFASLLPLLGLFLGGSIVWKSGNWNLAIAIFAVLTVVGVVGFLSPKIMRPIFVGWIIITFPIAWVISHTILLLAFYGVFLPIGLLLRVMGKDPLNRKWDKMSDTYWQPHEMPEKRSRYFRQF